jgi:hypothetical protein
MKLKSLMNAALIATAACLPTLQAEEAPKPASSNGGHQMGGMGAGMMMNDDRLKQMQEHLLKMHELSSKILAATDPKEKDRLKAEQLELMKEHEKLHHMMMQQHMQEMMKNKGGMQGMQHGGNAGGMGNMQHGTAPAAPAGQVPAPAAH